jgi:hypothetical protein
LVSRFKAKYFNFINYVQFDFDMKEMK